MNNVLKGEAFGPGNNGIVSPAIKNYSYSSVNGHKFNNTEAQKLLAITLEGSVG